MPWMAQDAVFKKLSDDDIVRATGLTKEELIQLGVC
jgi:hypothetical protein